MTLLLGSFPVGMRVSHIVPRSASHPTKSLAPHVDDQKKRKPQKKDKHGKIILCMHVRNMVFLATLAAFSEKERRKDYKTVFSLFPFWLSRAG